MNIFGVGGAELIVILLIMLVVAGPQRMIRWAYILGVYIGKFRKMWSEVVDVLQKEVDAAGIDIDLPTELPTRKNMGKIVSDLAKPYTDEIAKEIEAVNTPIGESIAAADQLLQEEHESLQRLKTQKAKKIDAASPKEDTKPDENPRQEAGFGTWANPSPPGNQTTHEVEK